MPKNFEAIVEWVKTHRPDLVQFVPQIQNNNIAILMLTTGFEAGRQFQHDNPEFPLNQPHLYLEK